MNKETLKQILDAMKLHTAETHPLVETERAMEMIEAELAQPEALRMADILENTSQMQPNADLSSQEIADELRRLYHSEREGRRYAKELRQDNATLREQNTWLDAKLAGLECKPVRREQRLFMEEQEFYESPTRRQPLTTAGYIQALGPLLEHIECSSGTLHCIVRTIEALHGIKEQP